MKLSRSGFTLLELMVVLMVGGVLTSISVRAFGDVQVRMSQRQSQRAFQAMHARARAIAVETGVNTSFMLDTAGDSIWIERNDTTLELVNLQEEYGIDLVASSTVMNTCFNARGFADEACTSYTGISLAGFRNPSRTRYLFMLPLGGLVEQSGA